MTQSPGAQARNPNPTHIYILYNMLYFPWPIYHTYTRKAATPSTIIAYALTTCQQQKALKFFDRVFPYDTYDIVLSIRVTYTVVDGTTTPKSCMCLSCQVPGSEPNTRIYVSVTVPKWWVWEYNRQIPRQTNRVPIFRTVFGFTDCKKRIRITRPTTRFMHHVCVSFDRINCSYTFTSQGGFCVSCWSSSVLLY